MKTKQDEINKLIRGIILDLIGKKMISISEKIIKIIKSSNARILQTLLIKNLQTMTHPIYFNLRSMMKIVTVLNENRSKN